MKLLAKYLAGYKGLIVVALVLATINQVFSLLDPQIARLMLDNYITKTDQYQAADFVRGISLLLLAGVGIAFVSRTAKTFQDYYVNLITQKVGAQLYANSVAHTFALPYAVFEDQRSGELLGKLQKARSDAEKLMIGVINVLFMSLVGIVFVLAYATWIDWRVGLAYFALIPIVAFTTTWISRRIKNIQSDIVREITALSGSTTETIRNVELVKSLGLENQETERLNVVNQKVLDLELKKNRMVRGLNFIQGTVINATRSALVFLIIWLIFGGTISVGEYITLLIYSFFIFGPLAELGGVIMSYQEARASFEAVEKILNMPVVEVPADAVTIDKIERIEFENASFNYNDGLLPAVKNVNLKIDKGQTVAFVGPSGSGKTTLVKLILGLYAPTEGRLLINGTDNAKIDYEQLRLRVGYVSQDTQLFAGTVRENLKFVKPDATDEECLVAIRQAAADKILDRGGMGLDTKIGEGGLKLSGGERQRLAIARSLLRQPDLIVFDEATSSLDSLTESEIIETIEGITKTRPDLITIMVAHRLSTIAGADKIFVMEKGELAEAGSHSELLERKALYFALWRGQQAGV